MDSRSEDSCAQLEERCGYRFGKERDSVKGSFIHKVTLLLYRASSAVGDCRITGSW